MRAFLLLLTLTAIVLGTPAIAAGDDPAPAGVSSADDGYVAPSCDDADVGTLAVAECSGFEAARKAEASALEAVTGGANA